MSTDHLCATMSKAKAPSPERKGAQNKRARSLGVCCVCGISIASLRTQVYAVKHFHLDGTPETRNLVREEARIMTKLRNHPNVLRLHAVAFAGEKNSESDGFYLMDLCTSTLNDRLLQV